jgi:hypothetical protein
MIGKLSLIEHLHFLVTYLCGIAMGISICMLLK